MKTSCLYIASLFVYLSGCAPSAFAQDVSGSKAENIPILYISEKQQEYTASDYWHVMNDSTMGMLNIEHVSSPQLASRFAPLSQETVPVGLREMVYWIRLRLCDTLSGKPTIWMFAMKDFSLRTIDIYFASDNGAKNGIKQEFTRASGGSIIPLEQRSIEWYGVAATLPMQPRTPLILYIRIAAHYVDYDFAILSNRAFAKSLTEEHFLFGLYYGAMLLLVLYSVALWVALREKMFLLLSGYILAVLLHQITQDGMIYELAPFFLTKFRILFVALGAEGTIVLLILIVFEFLPLRSTMPRTYGFLRLLLVISICQFGIGFFLPRTTQLLWLNVQMIVTPILLMVMIIARWRESGQVERLFLASCIALFLGEGMYALSVIGWITMNWYQFFLPMQSGMLAQVILLSLATGNKVNALRREREQALRKAEQNEQYRAQSIALQQANTELDAALHDLRETQTQLVTTERIAAIGLLTAGVMHEINNPNAAVVAALFDAKSSLRRLKDYFFSLLDDTSKQSKKAQQFTDLAERTHHALDVAASGAERVKQIVANLQNFSKHQRTGVYRSALATEVRTTIEIFHYRFSNVSVHINLDERLEVTGNFGELNQVFLNLLVNAAEAGATVIHLASEVHKTTIQICFADNGKGISEETHQKIFEPFFSTKGASNSGLGLSISKQIIERHGGTIRLESTIGVGTTFIVELPQAA